jgi:hypothetical protein
LVFEGKAGSTMKDTADDLRAEHRELAGLCRSLTPAQWRMGLRR